MFEKKCQGSHDSKIYIYKPPPPKNCSLVTVYLHTHIYIYICIKVFILETLMAQMTYITGIPNLIF